MCVWIETMLSTHHQPGCKKPEPGILMGNNRGDRGLVRILNTLAKSCYYGNYGSSDAVVLKLGGAQVGHVAADLSLAKCTVAPTNYRYLCL